MRESPDPDERITSCFYGRQAINVDLCREIMGQIPGSSADDFERDMLGSVRPDARPVDDSLRRLPVILAKAPRVLATQARAITRRHDEQLRWWRDYVLDGVPVDPLTLLDDALARFVDTMRLHVRSRTLLQGMQAQATALCERAGRPDLVPVVLSGYGSVTETGIANDLWQVAAGSMDRDAFVRAHGFHGSNEGNPRSTSWREDPTQVDRLVRSTEGRSVAPREREAAAVARRERAERELLAATPRGRRALTRAVLRGAGTQVRNLELGKGAYVAAIDGCRKAVRLRAATLVREGRLSDPSDAFHLTLAELRSTQGDLDRLVSARAEAHRDFESARLPVTFVGMPQPLEADVVDGDEPDELVAAAGAPGVVEGVVRVVLDPDDVDDLEDDVIIVCTMTDPGWAPLFSVAAGLVVDVGGPASHGAIVAREMGIPCVIGTGRATTWLKSGDRVRIDGSAGRVERFR